MSTLEQRRDAIAAETARFCKRLMGLVEDAGGDPDYLQSWPEKMADDLAVAFSDAIEARDERRTPESRAAYRADLQRDLHNA